MNRLAGLLTTCLLVTVVATAARADYLEVARADAAMDLEAARRAALAIVADRPDSVEALAAASWWLDHLGSIADPDELLHLGVDPAPELGWTMLQIAGHLDRRTPAGVVREAELVGPWGTFGQLALARDEVPPTADWPSPDTPWAGPESHFRVRLAGHGGWTEVPAALQLGGAVTAAYTVSFAESFDGWLVLEGRGSLHLEVDGRPVDGLEYAGLVDAGTAWYRVQLAPGAHRLAVTMAPVDVARVRLSLVDQRGRPAPFVAATGVGPPWASSEVASAQPPVAASAGSGDTGMGALLVAAEIARLRHDPRRHEAAIRALIRDHADHPLARLAAADFALFAPNGAAPEHNHRLAQEHLRMAAELPAHRLLGHVLAERQEREDDAEALLDELIARHPDDPRVLRLRIRNALDHDWGREAEEAVSRLAARVGDRFEVDLIRLEVLEAEPRWAEARTLLHRLTDRPAPDPELVSRLLSNCDLEQAASAMARLRDHLENPDLDAEWARIWLRRGQADRARSLVDEALATWGPLPRLSALGLAASAGTESFGARLMAALKVTPADARLHALAWKLGLERPFWEEFEVDALELARAQDHPTEGLDSILILDQAVERVFADGSSLYYYHGLSKALTPEGVRRTSQLQQMPGLIRLSLRIVKPDGRVVVPADVTAEGATPVLREVEPGDLVEEKYVAGVDRVAPNRRGHLPPYTYRFADADRAFGLSEYALVLPEDLDLNVAGSFDGLEYTDRSTDGIRTVRWRSRGVPPMPTEPFAPPAADLLPWVTYGFGVDWSDVGDSLRERMLPALRTTMDLEDFACQRLGGYDDPEDGLRAFVDALIDQVEAGRQLLDPSRSAGLSFSLGSGNRLGIAAGALASCGWDVDLVMARPRVVAGAHLEVPSTDVFMAPVLRLRTDGRELWLDLREESAGIDRIGPTLQGGDALLVPLTRPEEEVRLVDQLPAFANPQLVEHSALVADVALDGTARVEFTMWLRDVQAQQLRETITSVPEDRLGIVYARMAGGIFPGTTDVTGSFEEDGDALVLQLRMTLPGACEPAGGGMTCRSLVVARPLSPQLASLPERRYPLILDLPVDRRHRLELRLPEGWHAQWKPRRIETRWGSVTEEIEPAARGPISDLRLRIPAVTVPPEDYPQFARFCRAVDELVSRPPMIAPQN